MNALVRGHVLVMAEDEERMIRGVRLAVWGSAEDVDRALESRRPDDDDGGDDGLAEALAVWGLRLEE